MNWIMKLRWIMLLSAVMTFLTANETYAGKALSKSDKKARERRAEKYLREIAVFKKRAEKLTAAGQTAAADALMKYTEALNKFAEAEKADKPEDQKKMETEALSMARYAAAQCARLNVDCAYKDWSSKDRMSISLYQNMLMARQLADKAKDDEMTAFIDKFTVYLHQELCRKEKGLDAEDKKKLDDEGKLLRQQLAKLREKFNRYKIAADRKTAEEKTKLLEEGAAAAPQPPEPEKPAETDKDKNKSGDKPAEGKPAEDKPAEGKEADKTPAKKEKK